jgi:hypothetical protein
MKLLKLFALVAVWATASSFGTAQSWASFLLPGQAIDWSTAGVGTIPARTVQCASLTSSATLTTINSALASCKSGETVSLAAGTYTIKGSLHVPSNVTLRGAGADKTILNATGTGEAVVLLGSGSVPLQPLVISSGGTTGSTQIVLASTVGVSVGKYLVITETNDSSYVTAAGSGGNCNWCDGGWSTTGNYAKGQIVAVTAVSGNSITVHSGAVFRLYSRSDRGALQHGGKLCGRRRSAGEGQQHRILRQLRHGPVRVLLDKSRGVELCGR